MVSKTTVNFRPYFLSVASEDYRFGNAVRKPMRANMFLSLNEVDRQPWRGHAVLMDKMKEGWQRNMISPLWRPLVS